MTREERKVIVASSLGTVFEWYDFYLYGSLAAIIGAQFFSAFDPTTRNVFALLAFAAGFLVRPFGALVFGRIGDLVGRKYTFLITIVIMGLSTFLVGLLPSYNQIGWIAPVILILLRMAQGLALGGEYGGAAVYVAEHAPQGRRGFYTSWIQTTATVGLLLSLMVILALRTAMGEAGFTSGEGYPIAGWRIPFLLSVVLLAISVWIRLQMNESPAFKKMKEEGTQSKAPLSEAFGQWRNAKMVIIALLGLVAGQAVVWYTGQFYALFFMQSILKVDLFTSNVLIAWSLILGTGGFIFFGSLSDRIGRKPVILGGCLIAAITYFPLFMALTDVANPTLSRALNSVKVQVLADPASCGSVFDPRRHPDLRQALRRRSRRPRPRRRQVRAGERASRLAGPRHLQWQGCPDRPGNPCQYDGLHGGGCGGRLSKAGRSKHRKGGRILLGPGQCSGPEGHRDPPDPRPLRDGRVRPDRGGAGRVLSDADPVHGDVAALPHRQRLVRRLPPSDLLRHGGGDGRHLLRALVPGRDCARHFRHRPPLRAGDEGPGHLRRDRDRDAVSSRRDNKTESPASSGAFFLSLLVCEPSRLNRPLSENG
jgi:MFS family permease